MTMLTPKSLMTTVSPRTDRVITNYEDYNEALFFYPNISGNNSYLKKLYNLYLRGVYKKSDSKSGLKHRKGVKCNPQQTLDASVESPLTF